jgi:hypothetical protein
MADRALDVARSFEKEAFRSWLLTFKSSQDVGIAGHPTKCPLGMWMRVGLGLGECVVGDQVVTPVKPEKVYWLLPHWAEMFSFASNRSYSGRLTAEQCLGMLRTSGR